MRASLAIAACIAGCMASQPDVGRYSSTAASPAQDPEFRLPRDRKVLVATVPGQAACALDLVAGRLHAMGVRLQLPQDRIDVDLMSRHQRGSTMSAGESASGLEDAIVLAVFVDALEGPGGSWHPMETMGLKSAHRRSDVGLAVYDGGTRSILWSGMMRARGVLDCDDAELVDMIRAMTSRIQ